MHNRNGLPLEGMLPACVFMVGLAAALAPTAATAGDLFEAGAFSTYAGDLDNGRYMANAAGCMGCHASAGDVSSPAGGARIDSYVGTVFMPNITSHANGVGGFSNADYLNAVINGISPEGRHYLPVFPYGAYAGMKPEDVLDIKAYIATLEPSDNRPPAHEISFPYNTNFFWAMWKRGNFDVAAFQPGDGSQMSRGRYLAESVGACGQCHTPRTMDYGLNAERPLEGEIALTGEAAPAITPQALVAAGPKTFAASYLENGARLSGSPFASSIKAHIAQGHSALTEEDRLALTAYLTGEKQVADKPALQAEASCAADVAGGAAPVSGLPAAADDFVGRYCRNCHGAGQSAQGSFPAGDLDSIARNAAFVTPGDRGRSMLYTSVASGRMPYGPKPSDEEVEALGAWIDSLGAAEIAVAAQATRPPRMREPLSWRGEIDAAMVDIGALSRDDRRFMRYFSYRQLYNGYFPCETAKVFASRMELFSAGFNKALNSVSLGPVPVVPVAVATGDGTLVRVDLRDLGWEPAKWDLLTAAYPYGYDPASDAALQTLATDAKTSLPVIRTGWFMANALQPEIYHGLMDLTDHIRDLEDRIGVDVDANIRNRRVVRAAFEEGSSGVSDHNRMVERHDAANGGYYWKSYDFAGSRGLQSLRQHPHGPVDAEPLPEDLGAFHHDGGEMIFSLPNGLQGYYLSDHTGKRIDRGPTQIVSFRERPIGKGIEVINARSCVSCHADGMIAKRDQLRQSIETSPNFSLAQRDLLLQMYVPQDELTGYFERDRAAFVKALDRIGATEKAPDGSLKSRSGPGGAEIITWFADTHEDDLDADRLAAEFNMTPEEFEGAIKRVKDPHALRLALDWLTQLKGGSKIPRFEVEEQYAAFVEPLLNLRPLHRDGGSAQPTVPEYKDAAYRDDGYKPAGQAAGKLEMAVDVPATDVHVNDKLSFTVTANQACELQIFYVETDGTVEVIPQEMIGEPYLQPGVGRRIPDASVGDLIFDTPAYNESLVLFCQAGGLGDARMSAADARGMIASSTEKPTRGLMIRMHEKNKQAEARLPDAEKGKSALQLVTFNVRER
ncbi:hypothetical protein DFR52_102117 [Hoeflea marina]|uniref:Cytochrome c domain-containing protein n=1 Tax=Hoeflea marina TaxID=274592 RepID=A0A317PKG6_9HYPH|nr:hypothetical protein [Hoeflea marina]PWW01455.1 hypothetical protein DFR52_102117 [Hoeflea marina]